VTRPPMPISRSWPTKPHSRSLCIRVKHEVRHRDVIVSKNADTANPYEDSDESRSLKLIPSLPSRHSCSFRERDECYRDLSSLRLVIKDNPQLAF